MNTPTDRYPLDSCDTKYFDGAAFTGPDHSRTLIPNQDRYGVKDNMAIVLDGVGGGPAADIATMVVVDLFEQCCGPKTDLKEFLKYAHRMLVYMHDLKTVDEYEQFCEQYEICFSPLLDTLIRNKFENQPLSLLRLLTRHGPFIRFRAGLLPAPHLSSGGMAATVMVVRVMRKTREEIGDVIGDIEMVWVGDCKAALFEDEQLCLASKDRNDRMDRRTIGDRDILKEEKNRALRREGRRWLDDALGRRGETPLSVFSEEYELKAGRDYTAMLYSDGISDNLIEEDIGDLAQGKTPSESCLEVLELLDKMLAARIIEFSVRHPVKYQPFVRYIEGHSGLRKWRKRFVDFIKSHDLDNPQHIFEDLPALVAQLEWSDALEIIEATKKVGLLGHFSTPDLCDEKFWVHLRGDDRAIMILKLRLNTQNGSSG